MPKTNHHFEIICKYCVAAILWKGNQMNLSELTAVVNVYGKVCLMCT